MNNDPDYLGELPTMPADPFVSERHRPGQAVRDLAADLLLGVMLGIAIYGAGVLLSWWIA